MSYKDFMNKVRQLDNVTAKWMMRHFYFMFFQGVLVALFVFWFINTLKTIDISVQASDVSIIEKSLSLQNSNQALIVLVMILNSFWMLYIFNCMQRMITHIRDINFNFNRYLKNKKSH